MEFLPTYHEDHLFSLLVPFLEKFHHFPLRYQESGQHPPQSSYDL